MIAGSVPSVAPVAFHSGEVATPSKRPSRSCTAAALPSISSASRLACRSFVTVFSSFVEGIGWHGPAQRSIGQTVPMACLTPNESFLR